MKIYTQKQWEAETAPYKKELNTTDFDNACQTFRHICSEIGNLIGDKNFKGGYDDMMTFYKHSSSKTKNGTHLAIAWARM